MPAMTELLSGRKVGEEVVSPGNGRIVNIEDTDRYGKMVTILLGNYYKAYCGQLENVDYEIGDDIQEGDVIGTVQSYQIICFRGTKCIF